MSAAYLITSGSYADYKIHRAYVVRDAAEGFAQRINEWALRRDHDRNVAAAYVPPNAQYACRDPIETCPGCGTYYADLSNWIVAVEAVPLR